MCFVCSAFCVVRSAFCVVRSAFCVLRCALLFCVVRSAFCVLRCALFVVRSALCEWRRAGHASFRFGHARPGAQVGEVGDQLEQVTTRHHHHAPQLHQSAWCAWMLHDPSDSSPVSTQCVVDPVHPSSWTPLDGALCVLGLSRPVGPWGAHRRRLLLRVRAHLQRYVSFRFQRRLVAVRTYVQFLGSLVHLCCACLAMTHLQSPAWTSLGTLYEASRVGDMRSVNYFLARGASVNDALVGSHFRIKFHVHFSGVSFKTWMFVPMWVS
jgi:hypothetical protein